MDEYRLVCLDIDGTLLNSRHMISDKTKEVIGLVVNEKHIMDLIV